MSKPSNPPVEQPPEPIAEDDKILDRLWDNIDSLPPPVKPTPAEEHDVPDVDAQRAQAAYLGYKEHSREWTDFCAGWWYAMHRTPVPTDETKAFKEGHAAQPTMKKQRSTRRRDTSRQERPMRGNHVLSIEHRHHR